MKKISIFILSLLTSGVIFAQSGAKWATGLNGISTGDAFGTSNNFPLLFFTNNTQKMSLGTNGVLKINNLSGSGNRFLQTDPSGNIMSLPIGSSSQVLLGDGTLGNVPGGWKTSGNNLFWLAGNVGIGTAPNPLYKLDVLGDAHVSNNLYVGGGVVVTSKVDASVEVKAGDVIVNGTGTFNGASKFAGSLTASQGVMFDNSNTVGVSFKQSTTSGSPSTFSYGKATNITGNPCAAAPAATYNHLFGGVLQIYDADGFGNYIPNSGLLNLQTWPGGSSIDASIGGTTGGGGLLLNYFCGNNTFINTGPNGGTVYAGKTVIGNLTQKTGPYVNAMLTVNGITVSKEIVVTQQNWADFVFAENYNLPSLKDVELYYKSNKHLKDIPSEKEVMENGISIGEMNKLLLKKIEELTLYAVDQSKTIDLLKKDIEVLKNK